MYMYTKTKEYGGVRALYRDIKMVKYEPARVFHAGTVTKKILGCEVLYLGI